MQAGRALFGALESWRGILALSVALYHLSAAGHFYNWDIVRHSNISVLFFFVLSGFVMMHAYGARLDTVRQARVFTIKRFGRLYPLHFAMLMAFLAFELVKLALVAEGAESGQAPFTGVNSLEYLGYALVLLNGIPQMELSGWNFPSWSISTEFYTYLIFAVWCVFFRRWRWPIAIMLCVVTASMILWRRFHPGFEFAVEAGFLRCVYGFFLGAMAYTLHQRFAAVKLKAATLWELGAVAALLSMYLVRFPGINVLAGILFSGAIIVFARGEGAISRLLTTNAPSFLGRISYSIYMTHAFVLALMTGFARYAEDRWHLQLQMPNSEMFFFGNAWTMDALALGYLGAVVTVSVLTYRWIEAPGRDFFARLAEGGSLKAAWSAALAAARLRGPDGRFALVR
ncbi:MAG: acyltransferase family protein [Hyphomonadaceae bacterium]